MSKVSVFGGNEMASLFVTTEDLEKDLGLPGLVVVDVRPKLEFVAGHIFGAVQTEWRDFSDPDSDIKGLLDPQTSCLEEKLSALGIGNENRVVVYTDPFDSWGSDGRIYWMLSYLGHQNVQVLDGGWVKWKREGRKTEIGFANPDSSAFKASVRPELIVLKDEMKTLVGSRAEGTCLKSHVVIDARSSKEYNGAVGPGIPRGGHVPLAINIPWDQFFNEDASIKSREELQRVFRENTLTEDQEIICYCTGGVRSAWLLTVFQFAGYSKVRNYTGSWWEWSRDFSLPIET
jgi:thiosulfate/3-mercaptopyruvate sulfurtransferase|tara:strand:- start:536 stop:1402 length:867 start_codon:yes stop_codon:yes gene_type:complete